MTVFRLLNQPRQVVFAALRSSFRRVDSATAFTIGVALGATQPALGAVIAVLLNLGHTHDEITTPKKG